MTWVETLPLFLAVVAILLVPGLLVGAALGARRLVLLALAPGFTISVIAIGTLANHVLGFRWALLPVLITAVILAALVFGLRMLWRKRWPMPRASSVKWGVWLAASSGLIFAVVAIAARFTAMFGSPNHISQTFDNVYHLNAVHYILDTGNASPLTIGSLSYAYDGRMSFYPDIWHALVALAVDTTGATIPVATNVVNIAIAGVAWPLACMLLVRQIFGSRPVALLSAGVLSAAFAAFPYMMVDFGVLYPNVLSISLLPAALATVAMVAGFGVAESLPAPARWVALAGILPGLMLAHPSTLMALLAFSAPIAVAVIVRHFRKLRARNAKTWAYVWAASIAAAVLSVAALTLLILRPTQAQAFWGPRESVESAAISAVTNSGVGRPADFAITVLMLLGIWALARRRTQLWMIGSYAVAAGLYIICASFPANTFRYGFTGPWYNDSFRLAALLPVVVLPLAAVGATWLSDAFASLLARWRTRKAPTSSTIAAGPIRPPLTAVIVGVFIAIALSLATQFGPALAFATDSGRQQYAFTEKSALLSPDEFTLLERLDSEVPADAMVVGSPWTGASLVYALSDRRALLPHIYGERDEDTITLMDSLRDADTDAGVCDAVRDQNAFYVLDFGKREVHGAENTIPGFVDLEDSSAVELIDREGDARLYHVTACG